MKIKKGTGVLTALGYFSVASVDPDGSIVVDVTTAEGIYPHTSEESFEVWNGRKFVRMKERKIRYFSRNEG